MRSIHVLALSAGLAAAATLPRTAPAQAMARVCDSSIRAGGFRLHLTGPNGQVRDALLVLEKSGSCLSALVVVDGGPPAAMDSLIVERGVLTARVSTPDGDAKVQLTLNESDATGLIRSGRTTWKVEGKRTA